MIGWLIAALIFMAILLLRVGVTAEYSGEGMSLWAKIGLWNVRLFPSKKKKEKRTKEKKIEEEKTPEKKKAVPEEEEKATLLQSMGGPISVFRSFLPLILDASRAFFRKLRMDELRMQLIIPGSDDPASAAIRYGQANAVLGGLWRPLIQGFRVQDGQAGIAVDFEAEEMALYAKATVTAHLGGLLWLGLYFGIKTLKNIFALRKNHKPRKAV